jgi:hypothetical protein
VEEMYDIERERERRERERRGREEKRRELKRKTEENERLFRSLYFKILCVHLFTLITITTVSVKE